MPIKTENRSCPVCSSAEISVFADIRGMPVHCNILLNDRETALNAKKRDIRLGFCAQCGHIYNTVFDPQPVIYNESYENSLHYSQCFQDYARSLAVKLIERYNLYNKDIIEIGCGKGDFLLLLSELGGNRGVGFDASYEQKELHDERGNVEFIKEQYSGKHSGYKADLICSRHVLEHIDSPRAFLEQLRAAVNGRLETVLFFEVPNSLHMLRELAVWDIIYEHCSYFNHNSLSHLFNAAGFKTLNVEEAFESQFLCIEAIPSDGPVKGVTDGWTGIKALKKEVASFSRRYMGKLLAWKNELERIQVKGQTAVVWGSGSKGVSFLNAFKHKKLIKFAVDINPNKQGKFIPGSGQEIVTPEFLKENEPDVIIVMNPAYIGEIWQTIKDLDLKSTVLTA